MGILRKNQGFLGAAKWISQPSTVFHQPSRRSRPVDEVLPLLRLQKLPTLLQPSGGDVLGAELRICGGSCGGRLLAGARSAKKPAFVLFSLSIWESFGWLCSVFWSISKRDDLSHVLWRQHIMLTVAQIEAGFKTRMFGWPTSNFVCANLVIMLAKA